MPAARQTTGTTANHVKVALPDPIPTTSDDCEADGPPVKKENDFDLFDEFGTVFGLPLGAEATRLVYPNAITANTHPALGDENRRIRGSWAGGRRDARS